MHSVCAAGRGVTAYLLEVQEGSSPLSRKSSTMAIRNYTFLSGLPCVGLLKVVVERERTHP
jgi:hypothetical protein